MKTAELSWKQLAFFVAVSILPLLAWSSRNYSVSGQWSFSSIQDANIYIVRAALVKMEEEGMAYNEALNNLALSFREAQGSRALPGNSESQLQGQWATHYLLTHWTGYLRVVLKDIVKLLAGNSMKVIAWAVLKDDYYDPAMVPTHSTQTPLFQARDLVRRHPWLGAALAFNLMFLALMYVLSAIGVILAWKEAGWGRTLVLLSAVIYFSALSLGVDAHARYRLPLMPTLFFFAGGGTLQCLKRRARRGL